jgi:hypothetical protein
MGNRPFAEDTNQANDAANTASSRIDGDGPAQSARAVSVIAEEYERCAEVSAFLDASLFPTFTTVESSDDRVRSWAALSQWERQHRLHGLEVELAREMERLRDGCRRAEDLAGLGTRRCEEVEAYFRGQLESPSSPSPGEVAYRFSQIRAVRESAVQQLKLAARLTAEYAEAQGIVALAESRIRSLRRRASDIERARIRASSAGFLIGVLMVVLVAILAHFRFAH